MKNWGLNNMARVVKNGDDVESVVQCEHCKYTIAYKSGDIVRHVRWIGKEYHLTLFIYCPQCERAAHL